MYHSVVFIETRLFSRRLLELPHGTADEVLRSIQTELLADPERGDVIPGLAGVRKMRVSDPSRGKGKRGGLRCMYYHFRFRDRIYLLHLFSKGDQSDLSTAERKVLRDFVDAAQREV